MWNRVISAQAEGPCPTITSTFDVCQSCCVPDCTITQTLTNPHDCPAKVATVMTYYPCCTSKCPTGCATTQYSVVPPEAPTQTHPCPTVTKTIGTCTSCSNPPCGHKETISFRTDCPWPPPTQTYSNCWYPCPTRCSTRYTTQSAPTFRCALIPRATLWGKARDKLMENCVV